MFRNKVNRRWGGGELQNIVEKLKKIQTDESIPRSQITVLDVRKCSGLQIQSSSYQNHCLWDGNWEVGPKSIWKGERHKISKKNQSWREELEDSHSLIAKFLLWYWYTVTMNHVDCTGLRSTYWIEKYLKQASGCSGASRDTQLGRGSRLVWVVPSYELGLRRRTGMCSLWSLATMMWTALPCHVLRTHDGLKRWRSKFSPPLAVHTHVLSQRPKVRLVHISSRQIHDITHLTCNQWISVRNVKTILCKEK